MLMAPSVEMDDFVRLEHQNDHLKQMVRGSLCVNSFLKQKNDKIRQISLSAKKTGKK